MKGRCVQKKATQNCTLSSHSEKRPCWKDFFPQTSRSNTQNWHHHRNLKFADDTKFWALLSANFRQTLSLLLKTPCTTFPQFRPLCHNCVQNLVFLSFFCHFWLFFWLFPTIQSLFKQNLSLNGNERQMRSKKSDAELYTFFPFRKKTLLKRFFPPNFTF